MRACFYVSCINGHIRAHFAKLIHAHRVTLIVFNLIAEVPHDLFYFWK